MSNALTMFSQNKLVIPSHIGNFFGEESNIAERASVPSLGYEGKVWQISMDGEKTKLVKKNDDGDEEPLSTMRVVVLEYAKRRGRAYYEGAYDPAKIGAPVCASDDGVVPNANVPTPQASKCEGCPMSVKGSKITESGKAVTACSQHRMLAVVPANNLGFTPLRMKIAITSDYDKQSPDLEAQGWYAFSNYTSMLRAKGVQHTAALVTKMKFDPNAAYPKVLFSPDRWLTEAEIAQVAPVVRSDAVKALVEPHYNASPATDAPAARTASVVMNEDEDDAEAFIAATPKPVAPKAAAPKAAAPKTTAPKAAPKAQVVEDDAPEVTPKVVTAVSDDVASLLAEWGED